MSLVLRAIERVSGASGHFTAWLVTPLILATVYDVGARYLFNAPTQWAYEVGYMMMGAHALLGMALAHAMGWPLGGGLVFGLALSVASTVVLLRAMQERRLIETERGRIAVGWLIVEDIAMVLTLVLLPALAGAAGGATGGGLDVGALVGQVIGGGAGGAILTVVAGLIKNAMAGK